MDELEQIGQILAEGGLGFRDVEVFNLALLAKQGWRLIQYPDSLVARVMREKYFPIGSFLKASLGKAPSYAWRSIHQARELLDRGLVWRVENGEKIVIWGDRWLLNPPSNKVYSSTGQLDKKSTVSTLIDHSTNRWDYPLIQASFVKAEADKICSLPLSTPNQPDRLI